MSDYDWNEIFSKSETNNIDSVSLSEDGSIVAVGISEENNNTGIVRIYNVNSVTGKYEQLGEDIDGEASDDNSGRSVSLSSDGSIVAIGANQNDGNGTDSGHVRVYQYSDTSNNWIKLGDDIDGEASNDYSGQSVSLSSDGSIIAIGANQNDGNNNNSGHVRVYQYSDTSNNWTKLGEDIDGEASADNSGRSVSLSSDGSIVAIGANQNDGNGSNSGHVRVYQYSDTSNNWIKLGDDIDGEASNDKSGRSVSLSSDGSIVAIGAANNNSYAGHVRVYQRDTSNTTVSPIGWTKLGQDIDGEASYDKSGWSVSLSSDGTKLLSSCVTKYTILYEYSNNSWNKVKTFDNISICSISKNGSIIATSNKNTYKLYSYNNYINTSNELFSWTKLGDDIDGEAPNDKSGWSVSLSSDGSIVAIGAYHNNGNDTNSGHVRVYQYSNTNSIWEQLGEDIDGEASTDNSGRSVSLSSDGSIVAIGAYQNDGNGFNSGHVRVYQRDITNTTVSPIGWTKLGEDIDGEASEDYSGQSVSLSSDGSIVAIGSNENDGNGFKSGHVRVYQYSDTSNNWTKLGEDIDGEASYDSSGYSVSLSNDGSIVAIAAPYNGEYSGHVRVYQYSDTSNNWIKLGDDIDGEASNDYSGQSVSLSSDGTIVAIGAHQNDGNGTDSGHVRVYQYSDTSNNWIKLGDDIDGEASNDYIGKSVSLSSDGTIVAIGSPINRLVRVYKYLVDSKNWKKIGKDIYGEKSDDYSGQSVSLSSDGTIVAIGAHQNDGNGVNSGHVRVFKYDYLDNQFVDTILDETPTELDTNKHIINYSDITTHLGDVYNNLSSNLLKEQKNQITKGIAKKYNSLMSSGNVYVDTNTLNISDTTLAENTKYLLLNASSALNVSNSVPLTNEVNMNNLGDGEGIHVILEDPEDYIKLIGKDSKFITITKRYGGRYHINDNDETSSIIKEDETIDKHDIHLKIGSVTASSTSQTANSNICFIASTLVQTDQGQEQISKLIAGYHTIDGKEIKFITETKTKDTHLYKLKRNALGKNIPSREMTVTGNHFVEYDGLMVPVKNLIFNNKVEKVEYKGEKLYNILMDKHEIIKINNLNVETLHPNNLIARLYNNEQFQNMEYEEKKQLIKKFNKIMEKEGLIKYD